MIIRLKQVPSDIHAIFCSSIKLYPTRACRTRFGCARICTAVNSEAAKTFWHCLNSLASFLASGKAMCLLSSMQ